MSAPSSVPTPDLFSNPAASEAGYEQWRAARKQENEYNLLSRTQEDESGYERWRAEAKVKVEKKIAETMNEDAGDLPIATDGSGYEHWRKDMEEARLEFERRWGVPAGHRVRVQLRDDEGEREGVLHVLERIAPTKKHGLMLQLGGKQFRAAELVSVVRI